MSIRKVSWFVGCLLAPSIGVGNAQTQPTAVDLIKAENSRILHTPSSAQYRWQTPIATPEGNLVLCYYITAQTPAGGYVTQAAMAEFANGRMIMNTFPTTGSGLVPSVELQVRRFCNGR